MTGYNEEEENAQRQKEQKQLKKKTLENIESTFTRIQTSIIEQTETISKMNEMVKAQKNDLINIQRTQA